MCCGVFASTDSSVTTSLNCCGVLFFMNFSFKSSYSLPGQGCCVWYLNAGVVLESYKPTFFHGHTLCLLFVLNCLTSISICSHVFIKLVPSMPFDHLRNACCCIWFLSKQTCFRSSVKHSTSCLTSISKNDNQLVSVFVSDELSSCVIFSWNFVSLLMLFIFTFKILVVNARREACGGRACDLQNAQLFVKRYRHYPPISSHNSLGRHHNCLRTGYSHPA